jgi:hypothetical protein
LSVLLAGHSSLDAPSHSPLTPDGFPVEFSCCENSSDLRYTVEVAGEAGSRWKASLARCARLGAPRAPAWILDRVEELQRGASLRYGAWIGVRHSSTRDRFKLYAEVPEATHPAARRLVRDFLGHSGPYLRLSLRMIGYDLHSQALEMYFRAEKHWLSDFPLVPRRDSRGVLSWLADIPEECPRGYSVSLVRGEVAAVSLYTFAAPLFGGETSTRTQLRARLRAAGVKLPGYDALSRPLHRRAPLLPVHGMLALVSDGGDPTLRVSLSPPR